jgi:hypothetical protein
VLVKISFLGQGPTGHIGGGPGMILGIGCWGTYHSENSISTATYASIKQSPGLLVSYKYCMTLISLPYLCMYVVWIWYHISITCLIIHTHMSYK